MSKRVELLNRVDGSEMSPFLLCNLLARRTRQVANGRGVAVSSELVNETLREFLEGKLEYELDGQRLHSALSLIATQQLTGCLEGSVARERILAGKGPRESKFRRQEQEK
jgi:DNA-directed RNA polymerase subunit K/omega